MSTVNSQHHLPISIVIFIVVCSLEHSAKADITECYEMTDGTDYRGIISTTTTDKTCQRWTSQVPHAHSRTPENYPDTGVDDHNFCRNPDGEPTAWCYTTDPNTRWEVCDTGSPGKPCECYKEVDGSDYRGSVDTTSSGETCLSWTTGTISPHSFTPQNFPGTGLGDHNFCRNPNGGISVWCFTDPNQNWVWGFCDIGTSTQHCECYEMTDGADYRGSISITTTGKTCQPWTSQTPHAHSITPENDPGTGVGDHNFCRNPDGEPNAWCYTTDPNTRWEICDIGSTGEPCECYQELDGSDYRGRSSYTSNWKKCQKWTSQTPHAHSFTTQNYPDTGVGDHNFCRNPNSESSAWCFTMDPDVMWQYCNIGNPEQDCECYAMTDGADYRGRISTTTTDKTCQPWTSQTPHAHSRTPENYPDTGVDDHDFCRNPDGEPNAWCYTTDPNMRWDFCDIGSPGIRCVIAHDGRIRRNEPGHPPGPKIK